MTNRYPGRCASCRTQVSAGAGIYAKGKVLCASTACAREQGITRQQDDGRRCLEADGTVRLPFDRAALPILRSAPGARWDRDARVWRWSVAPGDLGRTLECARKLALDVPDELLAIAAHGTADQREAVERAERVGLYPFQREGVRWLAGRERALLADDMGLGKTVQALCAINGSDRVIVVAPASVKRVWRDEAARWRPDYRATIVDGKGALREPAPGEIVIVSTVTVATSAPVDCDVLIVDEAHVAKSHKAKRTQALRELGRKHAKRVWYLTGTPLLGRALDLWGTLSSLGAERDVFGGWMGFCRVFNGSKNRWGGWIFEGPSGPEAAERLRRVMLRRTKIEVLPDLPRKTYRAIEVDAKLTKRQRAQLDKIEQATQRLLDAGVLPGFEQLSAARALLAKGKIPAVLEIVETAEAEEQPLVVFSAHRAPVDALRERAGWAVITGDASADDRAAAVRRFQAGELKGIALTIAAGGVGLTLTRGSRVVFVDLDWTPALNLQAEDRVCRIGQTASAIQIDRLVADHALDARLSQVLADKTRLIAAAIEREAQYEPTAAAPSNAPIVDETDEERAARIAAAAAKAARAEADEAVAKAMQRDSLRAGGPPPPPPAEALWPDMLDKVQWLAERCDGARELDGAGYAKSDVALGHHIAAVGIANDDYAVVAAYLCRKYGRQLEDKC